MIGVVGGVKREVVAVGEVTGVRRDGLGVVMAVGWLPVVDEEMLEVLDTGL